MNHILYIKNMVYNRCIKVVIDELTKHNIDFGNIYFNNKVDKTTKDKINTILKKEGFEVLEDKEKQHVNQIKTLLIENINHDKAKTNINTSKLLTDVFNIDYITMSKLFSEVEGKTIEKFIIQQKIEKVKEFLKYGELNLSEISYELNYSSPQHLSRQFKQVTGLTSTQFKSFGTRKRIDKI